MNIRRVALIAAVVLTSVFAFADTSVSYTTTGSFGTQTSCSTSADATSITCGGMTIAFAGLTDPQNGVDVPTYSPEWESSIAPGFASTYGSLGNFITSGSTPTGTFNVPFSLTVTQTAPGPFTDSGAFSTNVAGSLLFRTSKVYVSFDQPTMIRLGEVFYDLTPAMNASGSLFLAPPSTNGGVTTLNAEITPVPEPTAMLLFGTGLTGLAGLVRKFRK